LRSYLLYCNEGHFLEPRFEETLAGEVFQEPRWRHLKIGRKVAALRLWKTWAQPKHTSADSGNRVVLSKNDIVKGS
jgi:hypothetical protein